LRWSPSLPRWGLAQPWLLPRQLDREGAAVLEAILQRMGIQVITGELCTQMEGRGQVERLRLKSGRTLEAEMVVISAGVRSNIALAKEAGLACNRGIVVDEHLQTSHPQVYAVGDVAEFAGRVWAIIPAAIAQGRALGAWLSGQDGRYEGIVPSATLKVSGVDLASIGEVNPEGEGFEELRRAEPERGLYRKLVLREGRIVGAILLGDRSEFAAVSRLISQGVDVSAHGEKLLEDGALAELARG